MDQKEEERGQRPLSNNAMSSAVAPSGGGESYTDPASVSGWIGGSSYGSSYGSNPDFYGHPPQPMMSGYSSSPPDPPDQQQYYSTAQYSPVPAYHGAPAPMPPAGLPPPPYAPPMYYGSWPGPAPPPMTHQPAGYGAYGILPPDARRQYAMGGLGVDDELFRALDVARRNHKATLFDIDGFIPDVVKFDESASRFIQRRLRLGTVEEKTLGLKAALSDLDALCRDQFGNFLVQGLFDFGTPAIKSELMDAIYAKEEGYAVELSMHMHGCRVIQKAIRCLDQEGVCKLVAEFHDTVVPFVRDPNGNHVIQRCIQVISAFAKTKAKSGDPDQASGLADQMQFIVDDIVANVLLFSSHRYGCRVVQRAIEHCVEAQRDSVLDGVVSCHERLIADQYGNYVIQQVLACGSEAHKAAVVDTLTKEKFLAKFTCHKYASNVFEALLIHGKSANKEKVLEVMMKDTRGDENGYCIAIQMARDPIANYVVSKAIEVSEGEQKKRLVELLASDRAVLAKSPYAKYVLQNIDKLEH